MRNRRALQSFSFSLYYCKYTGDFSSDFKIRWFWRTVSGKCVRIEAVPPYFQRFLYILTVSIFLYLNKLPCGIHTPTLANRFSNFALRFERLSRECQLIPFRYEMKSLTICRRQFTKGKFDFIIAVFLPEMVSWKRYLRLYVCSFYFNLCFLVYFGNWEFH